MSALIRPRGPLPRRVYWFRRALVLLVLVLLVVVAVRLVGRGGEESSTDAAPDTAANVAAAPRSTAQSPANQSPAATPSVAPTKPTSTPAASPTAKPSPTQRPLPKPDGPCDPADVLVTPVATGARPDGSVDLTLAFTTVESAACTFEVSSESVFVTISGEDRTVWASQHCGSAIPSDEVVARRSKAAELVLRWDGRESAVGCPEASWVDAGDYTIAAMARGSVNVRKTTFSLETSG